MSKTDADIRRREQDTGLKATRKRERVEEDMYFDEVPEGGCVYYGDIEMMEVVCLRCKRRECY